MHEGRLIGIAVRTASRAPMIQLEHAEVTTDCGVANDFRGKPGSRQITVLSAEDWRAACEELGRQLPWTTRRANLLVEGVTFADTAGASLRIGEAVLRVRFETEPCHRMQESCAGLLQALTPNWRGGVCCEVIRGASLRLGAPVVLELDDANPDAGD